MKLFIIESKFSNQSSVLSVLSGGLCAVFLAGCLQFPFLDHAEGEVLTAPSPSIKVSTIGERGIEVSKEDQASNERVGQTSDSSESRESVIPATQPHWVAPNCTLEFTRVGLCAELVWEKQLPPAGREGEDEEGVFILRFFSPSQPDLGFVDPGLQVAVRLWMPSMGHGSAPVKIDRLQDGFGNVLPGQYRVSEVYFVMSGDWEIQIKLKKGSTLSDQASFAVRVD